MIRRFWFLLLGLSGMVNAIKPSTPNRVNACLEPVLTA